MARRGGITRPTLRQAGSFLCFLCFWMTVAFARKWPRPSRSLRLCLGEPANGFTHQGRKGHKVWVGIRFVCFAAFVLNLLDRGWISVSASSAPSVLKPKNRESHWERGLRAFEFNSWPGSATARSGVRALPCSVISSNPPASPRFSMPPTIHARKARRVAGRARIEGGCQRGKPRVAWPA